MSIYQVFDGLGSKQIVGKDVPIEDVLELLEESARYSNGELTAVDLLDGVFRKVYQLWLGYAGGRVASVMVTELLQYPRKKVCVILAIAGETKRFANTFEVIKQWAAMNGAVELEAYCRPAITRLARRYGFFKKRDQISLDLRRYLQ
jgi:hypothetical protein